MKLLLVIVSDTDKNKVNLALVENGVQATIIYSTGGFLNRGTVTFMIGAEDDRVDEIIELIRKNVSERKEVCKSTLPPALQTLFFVSKQKIEQGGAVIFVIDIEEFLKV
ncbi:cyclic-di-AMP receptor [Caldicellulosiruptor morganii]|uniref:Cyclic-di-AMP receptor n=1 Tax=Caldicellulosiruptor morganii TaxID=1387555 RepID=A0ABY7BLJ3_9FIRM|nr:cyclic-di-AMP receptor [Caldicellulosiruptor morganii]WAM33708.1 cyclic-di-AMP receptor [Caldicellulosiruptor morganii]